MNNLSLSKSEFYQELSRFPNKHTSIYIDMPINHVIGGRFRLHFSWRHIRPDGSFDPVMSAQLLDMTKHGPNVYVVPDLLFDCIKENVTTDYRLYKHLDKWVKKSIEEYLSDEAAMKGERNCSDCRYASSLGGNAYYCRKKQYDIDKKTCFKPKKEDSDGKENRL